MRKRFAILMLLFSVGAAFFIADPAGAQYQPEGGFTVNPVNIIRGQTATVTGYCEIQEPVQIKLDNTTVVGTGTVPGVNDPQPRKYLATAQVSVVVTIPPATTVGPHQLYVYCHGTLIQILNITVLDQSCNTTGSVPPALGGVYGIYGGDPQGASPAHRDPDPNSSFQGLVTSQTTGMPIPNATVKLVRSDGTISGSSTQTDSLGYYAFPKTQASIGKQFSVRVIELGFTTKTSPLTLYSGTPVTVNLALSVAPGGPGVSGVVTDINTGQKLVGVQVRLWLTDSLGRYLATATDSNGYYNFTGIPQGSYQIQFAGTGYVTYWYASGTNRQTSTAFNVGASSISINAQLTGLCKKNPTLIHSFTDLGSPVTLTTGGVLLLMVGSFVLLSGSKKRKPSRTVA